MRSFALVVTLFALLSRLAAAGPLPDDMAVPAGFTSDDRAAHQFDFFHDDLSFPDGKRTTHLSPEGKTWIVVLKATPPNKTSDATSTAIRAALQAGGWALKTTGDTLVAHRTVGGHEQWLKGTASAGDVRATIIEVGPLPHPLTLAAPAKVVEQIADGDDFPYLGHLVGATLSRTITEAKTVDVSPPGGKEVLAGPPIVTKLYALPPASSPYERMVTYRDALTKAGWTIVRASSGGDSLVVAHYARGGRDLFAYLHDGAVSIADIGAQNDAKRLADALARDGHVAIYGIYFDVDKDVLKPESETALAHILALLQAQPKLRLEVQGHTDNTGKPAHNQQLSDARAAAVKKWLVAHKIDGARLTPKGYGETVPVGDNKTAEGRAKNRRVELKQL
jgi:outer membrane protein OmpA-like peptidoglycan-associated protein